MSTFLPPTRALRASACLVFSTALILCLALTCHAQNSAVNFTAAQPVALPPFSNGGFFENETSPEPACSGLYAAKFHPSSKMDFLATCYFPDLNPQANPTTWALLNQGNGTYAPVDDSASDAAGEEAVLSVDLNGDGFDDLVLLSQPIFSMPGFAVQLSNGDGTFKAPVYYAQDVFCSSIYYRDIVAGDFEDNGRMDIACAGTSLVIFHNNGSGVFTQVASYPLSSSQPILVAGDLNGDHKTDLAVVYGASAGTVTPYISEGNGQFIKGGSFSVGTSPISAAIGNFTSDAYADIAVANSTGVTVLLGSSSGAFSTSKSTPYPSPLAGFPTGANMVTGDFDKDGNLDLAFTTSAPSVIVFWGAGNGSFPSASAESIPALPVALVSTDINGDGRQDLAVAGFDGSVNLLYNLGGRTFRAAPNTHSPYSAGIVAADFNRDGKKDVAVVNTPSCAAPCDGTVTVFPGEGSYFNPGKAYPIGMHGSAIAVGDINGDGILDLVVTNATAGDHADTSILLGIKGGGFEPAHNIALGALSNDAFLVDMNGDGKLDLVEDSGVALGNGKGDFGSLIPFPDGITFSRPEPDEFNTHITVADFNGDGHPDVFAVFTPSGASQQQADVLINNGKGDFTATPLNGFDQLAENGFGADGVTAGPLHGAGINDIVVTGVGIVGQQGGSGGPAVEAYSFLNNGKGSFTLASSFVVQNSFITGTGGAVAIADFNHDGYPDFGFSSGNEFFVSTGPNFNTPTLVFAGSSPSTTNPDANLVVADFNNDGWPDVVFTNSYGISRLYNVPVPTVTPAALVWTAAGTQKVTIKNTTKTAQSIEIALSTSSPPPFKIASNTCSSSLAVGASCTISVEYSGAPLSGGSLYISANGALIDILGLNVN